MPNATIAASGNLSDAVDTGIVSPESRIVGFMMPSAWTAADLTFQGSNDNSTFNNVYDDDDAEVTVQAAASRFITLDEDMSSRFAGLRFIKVRSGTSGSPVTQASERVIDILVK